MRQEVSQPQSRFSALTREQMAVCGNNKPDQRERESEDAANSPLQLILLRRLPFHVVTWKMFWLKQKENLQAVWSIWSCNAHVLYTPKTLSLPPCVCMGVCSHCVAVTLCWTVANYKNDWVNSVTLMATLCTSAYKRASVYFWQSLVCWPSLKSEHFSYVTTTKLYRDQKCVFCNSWRVMVFCHSFCLSPL